MSRRLVTHHLRQSRSIPHLSSRLAPRLCSPCSASIIRAGLSYHPMDPLCRLSTVFHSIKQQHLLTILYSCACSTAMKSDKASPAPAKRPVGRPRKSPNASPAKATKRTTLPSKDVVLSSLVGEPSMAHSKASSPQRKGEAGQGHQSQEPYPTPYTASNMHMSFQRQQQAAMPIAVNQASANLQKMSTSSFYHSSTAPENQRYAFPTSMASSLPSASSILASPISPNFSIPSAGSSPSLTSNFSTRSAPLVGGYDAATAHLYKVGSGERLRSGTASTSSSGNGTQQSKSSGNGGTRSRTLSSATAAGASVGSASSPYMPYKALSSMSMQSFPSSASMAGMAASLAMSTISAKSAMAGPASSGLTLSMSSDGRACLAASSSSSTTPLNMSRSATYA